MSARVRKPNTKYDDEIVNDEGARKAISAFQREFHKKKKITAKLVNPAENPIVTLNGVIPVKRGRGPAKQKPPPPPPVLSSKEKQIHDAEEKLIRRAAEQKAKDNAPARLLPEGAYDVASLEAAVKRSVLENTSLILDWTTKEASMVGALCKVYWDGEHKWFYARILNYDTKQDKHHIYYMEDSTAEWISLEMESVMIADRLVLVKSKNSDKPWPALHYWASPFAIPRQKRIAGYIKGNEYCEYFNEPGVFDWGFIPPDKIFPLQEQYMPKNINKKYSSVLEIAQLEQETIDSVLETVLNAIRDNVYTVLSGERWVGLRVRASTQSINESNNFNGFYRSEATAMCSGTVVYYCGMTNQHYIVFDDEGLQPQWVTIEKGVIDVLIGPTETLPPSSTSQVALREEKEPSDCAMCGLKVLNEKGVPLYNDIKRCDCCPLVCHSYCVPLLPRISIPENSSSSNLRNIAVQDKSWTCWNCNMCFGCGVSSMKAELMAWCDRRVEPELGSDQILMVCGDCLLRYKHIRDFCPICLHLYATDANMQPLVPVVAPVVPGEPVALPAEVVPDSTVPEVVLCEETTPVTASKFGKRGRKSAAIVEDPIIVKEEPGVDNIKVENVTPIMKQEDVNGAKLNESLAAPEPLIAPVVDEVNMVECNECARWVHAECEGIDQIQYDSMTLGTHPVWGDEYLCPLCRIKLGQLIIATLEEQDTIGMFLNPVTTAVAKNYFDVIRNPMDISKMKSKCAKGQYKSLQTLRQDFELMCLNAIVFNQSGDEYWQHAKYFHEKVQYQFDNQVRLSHISAYGFEIKQLTANHKSNVSSSSAVVSDSKDDSSKLKRKGRGITDENGDKRIKIEGSSTVDSSESMTVAEATDDARLALMASSMLPSALASVSGNNEEMDAIDKENEANKLMSSLDVILPTACAPCPDPNSFMACSITIQTAEEAFYTCCMDTCLLCGSAGSSAMFLYCVDCGEAMHSFCADAPVVFMSDAVRLSWRCMNCKVCETCGSATEAEESSLIYCELCDRAYHIGCLVPAMPSVPQSHWFCNECVDCKTCKEKHEKVSDAIDAEGVMKTDINGGDGVIPKSWGFEFDKCQYCTNEEQREKQRILAIKNEELLAKQAEMMKKQRQLFLNVYLCNICMVDCSDSFLICRNCGQNSHPKCNPSSCIPWTKDRSPMDFSCEHCLQRMKHQPSHLGTSEQGAQLLSMVGSIQRTRYLKATAAVQRKKAASQRPILEHLMVNRHLLLAMIQWACVRAHRFERDDIGADLIIAQAIDRADMKLHFWVKTRAARFYSMWKRIGNKNKSEWILSKSNLMKGCDMKGTPLETSILGRYALMAAAFIAATSAEFSNNQRVVSELTAIANDMIARYPLRKITPGSENNPTYELYETIMTKEYTEANTTTSEGVTSSSESSNITDSEAKKNESATPTLTFEGEIESWPEGESRLKDIIRLIKSTATSLMCGPIGLQGQQYLFGTPESFFNQSFPFNIMRKNLDDDGDEVDLVGNEYWNLKSKATDAEAVVSETSVPTSPVLNGSKSFRPHNPALGYPVSILDNMKLSSALPGYILRSYLLFTGSKVSSGLFNTNAVNSPYGHNNHSSSNNSIHSGNTDGVSDGMTFFGQGVPVAPLVPKAVKPVKYTGKQSKASSALTASVAESSTNPSSTVVTSAPKQPKVNFAAAMGKHLESIVPVSLFEGDGHFAKKFKLQHLMHTTEEEEEVTPIVLSADDLEIYTAAETARQNLAKQYIDAQIKKEEDERRAIELENQRRFRQAEQHRQLLEQLQLQQKLEFEERLKMQQLISQDVPEAEVKMEVEGESSEVVESIVEDTHSVPITTIEVEVPSAVTTSEQIETDVTPVESTSMKEEFVVDNSNNVIDALALLSDTAAAVASIPETGSKSDLVEMVVDDTQPILVADEIKSVNGSDGVSVNVSLLESKSNRDTTITTTSVVNSEQQPGLTNVKSKRTKITSTLYKNYVTTADKDTSAEMSVHATCCGVQQNPDFAYPYCMEIDKVCSEDFQGNRTCVTRPLRGWSSVSNSNTQPWKDPRVCCFCHVNTENQFYGRLLTFSDGLYVHANCLRWSSDVTEREGILMDTSKARDRSFVATCHYCRQKGATVSCMNRRKCGRIYHLKCAALVNCVFLECKGSSDVDEVADFDVFTVVLCAEHAGLVVENPNRQFLKWFPMDPNRRLLIDDNEDTTVPEISELISQKRGNKVVRSGALSILSIGDPRIDLPEFHTTQYIYPYHFKSARIFWSAITPLQRTMYIFEILSESDLDNMSLSQANYVKACLEHNREVGAQYDHGTLNTPIFRVISLENLKRPIYTKNIEQAYDIIQDAVEHCVDTFRESNKSVPFRRRLYRDSFGLNAHQFFGLGQQFVRRAIELIPESTAAMVALLPHPQYVPSFKLPTEFDARRIHRLQLAAKMAGAMSANGCIRADGYVVGATRPMGVRITRMLTKVTDNEVSSSSGARAKQAGDDEVPTYDVDEEKEENRRVIEYNRQRYLEMSAAYVKNPNAKLEVQKSRIHGWGLFARINFEKNDILVEYIGEKIRAVIADKREAAYEDEGVGSCYLFRLDKDDIVDATKTGGMARFMNHCCEPNAYARVISSSDATTGVPEDKHIVIIAARDIQEGEEITYDYKFPIEEKKLKCYCGALKCQGSMN